MSDDPIVISGAARTPMGGMMGSLAALTAAELGALAIGRTVAAAGIANDAVDEVIMGNVLGAGQGQAPARQAARGAGLVDATSCLTINKMCGSGMKAVMLGHDLLKAGSIRTAIVGGMESMTNAPYLVPKGRTGYRFGHAELLDHMALDGLEDAYEKRTPMGEFAERTVERYGFTREDQDAFAIESLRRAKLANEDGTFDAEVVPATIKSRKGDVTVQQDDQPFKSNPDKIPGLRPAFRKDGTISAATASSISDGAASMLLSKASTAESMGLKPVARIVGHASHARLPAEFTIAPVHAIRSLLEQVQWSVDDVDVWEVNEAFAVVAMAAMKDIGIPHDKLNIHGGACALGHPIGASGARILVTLLNAMEKRGAKRGVASLCIGGGEATAVAIERL
ncbi:acetyl-CoA C-acyltransferase [Abyssibacter profundi]|uniref:Acetyl-CoA C-acetyltransferase n=1 Tax=Abyssibacter profundi TaxID=2182787 RepID=A0A383XQK2_9GAMM|nr:acetyl-CoA C-acyltransferase [Abyssibacter profundi]PWN54906.1 acetyl-CoA C-acetyltransferase [Abyssibacter profundi]